MEKEKRPLIEALMEKKDGMDILVRMLAEEKKEKKEEKAPDIFGSFSSLIGVMIIPAILPLMTEMITKTVTERTFNVKIESSVAMLPISIEASTAIIPIEIKAQSVTLNVNITGSTTTLNVNITGSTTLNVNVTNTVLDVRITASEATLNVLVQNATINIGIADQTVALRLRSTFEVEAGHEKLFWTEGQLPGYPSLDSKWLRTFINYTVPSGKTLYIVAVEFTIAPRTVAWMNNVYDSGASYVIENIGNPGCEFRILRDSSQLTKVVLNGKLPTKIFMPETPLRFSGGQVFQIVGFSAPYGVWSSVTVTAYEI